MANYINVSAALPIPSFTGTPTFGNEPLDVQFNDTTLSTGIQYWNWSFGDNTPWFNTTDITARNVTHTYSSPGSYTVNLSITNSSGMSFPATITNTTSLLNYISVEGPFPVPEFTRVAPERKCDADCPVQCSNPALSAQNPPLSGSTSAVRTCRNSPEERGLNRETAMQPLCRGSDHQGR